MSQYHIVLNHSAKVGEGQFLFYAFTQTLSLYLSSSLSGISKLALLKLLTKLETTAGFEEMMLNRFVDLIPCRAFELQPLDYDNRGVLTIDGEEIGGGGGGRAKRKKWRLRGEVVPKLIPIIST